MKPLVGETGRGLFAALPHSRDCNLTLQSYGAYSGDREDGSDHQGDGEMFTIKYNRTTNHIAGLEIRTVTRDESQEQISARGDVAYYAENACGTITRSRLATGRSFETVKEALDAARKGGRRLCKCCERAAEAMAAELESAPELPEGVFERDGKLHGPVKALRPLMESGKARMTDAGDLVLN